MSYTLYQVHEKSEKKPHTSAIPTGEDAKAYVSDPDRVDWLDLDLRTLREIPFPEGEFRTGDLDGMYYIFFNGELVVSWDDKAHIDYPEDLIWSRDIYDLVNDAIKLGKLIARKEMEEA